MSWSSWKKKRAIFVLIILSEGIFLTCALSKCIVYWIHFQNIHTFTYQKALLHTFFCLFLKLSKAFCVSLMQLKPIYVNWTYFENKRREYHTLTTAYSRTIFHSTIECCPPCCPLLWKLYKALFWCKHLERRLNREGVKFSVPFFQKYPFFIKKCPFWQILNTTLNF